MQETPFRNPAPALDQFLVHDGNLSGRPAETDQTQFQPESESLPEADGGWRIVAI
jgi:hypothetical protein